MGFGHVAQRAGRRYVRDGGARADRKHGVGHGDQRIFLSERHAVLADEGQTVDVGIDGDAQVGLLAYHGFAQADEIGRQRLRIVGEMAVRLTVERDAGHAEGLEEGGHTDAAYGVDGIEHHLEAGSPDGRYVDEGIIEHGIDVRLREILLRQRPDPVDVHEIEVFRFGHLLQGLSFGIGQELALFIEEFQGVPLLGVMRGGEDDTAVGVFEADGHFRRGRGSQSGVDHVDAAGKERAGDHVVHHLSGDTGVAADNHFIPVFSREFQQELTGIGCREFDNVERGESVADRAADGTPDTGNGLDECHIFQIFTVSFRIIY